jgi:hypothetical protein
MFAGSFMMGAKDRLLPPSVPYRFFAVAVVMQAVAWALLLVNAPSIPGFTGGLGPALASLHVVTLGVLAMTAIGAAFQLLPVATSRQLGPIWACRLTFWLFTPGVILLCLGLAIAWPPALHGGAALTVAGLMLAGTLMARTLRGVTGLPGVVRHAWTALASLLALAVLGLLLVVDFTTGFLPDHGAFAAAHATLAAYGFMGNLAFGFSYVLMPMFVLGRNAPDATGKRTALLAGLALVIGGGGLLLGSALAAAFGAVIFLGAVVLHSSALATVLKTRMKKRLEPFFRMVFPAAILLPISLLTGLAVVADVPLPRLAPLWGFLMVFGWLLTLVTGLLQRIMPFLASMHSGMKPGTKPLMLSELVAQRPLDIHALCHGAAVVLVAAGIAADMVPLVQAGAVCGLAGAIAFIVFAVELGRRYTAHDRASSPSVAN